MPTTSISPNEQLKPRAHAPAGGSNLIASFKNDIIGQTTTSFATSTKAMHGDEVCAFVEATTLYHGNQQFSVTALSDSSGNVSERYAYTAYGQPTFLNASGAVQTSSAASNRYTYTGREWDSTLGLHHFRARWMSGMTGRFLTRDPIGYRGDGINLHQFMLSSSLNFTDSSGESIDSISAYMKNCVDKIKKGNPTDFCKCVCAPIGGDKCRKACVDCMWQSFYKGPCECMCDEMLDGNMNWKKREACRKECAKFRGDEKSCGGIFGILPTCQDSDFKWALSDVVKAAGGGNQDKKDTETKRCEGGYGAHYRYHGPCGYFTVLCCPCCELTKKGNPGVKLPCKLTG